MRENTGQFCPRLLRAGLVADAQNGHAQMTLGEIPGQLVGIRTGGKKNAANENGLVEESGREHGALKHGYQQRLAVSLGFGHDDLGAHALPSMMRTKSSAPRRYNACLNLCSEA